jgi:hypothetical protein
MRRGLILALAALALAPAPAAAHRINWLPVRAYAETQAAADARTTASAYPGVWAVGRVAGRCWRRSNHVVGCPIAVVFGRYDAPGSSECVASVVAEATRRSTNDPRTVRWRHTPLRCR